MPWGQLTEILWKMSFPHLFGKFTRTGTLAFLPALASTPWEASAFLNAALGFSTFPWISPLIPTECGFYHFDPFSGPLRCISYTIYIYILYIHIFSNPEIDRHVGNPGNKHIFSGIAWKHFSIFGCAIHIYDHIWECMLFIMHSIHLCRWYIYMYYVYICACVMHFHM